MDQEQYSWFSQLRQQYYIAGRSLMINHIFDSAAINFGYAIEMSLKFILSTRGHPKRELMQHDIEKYYRLAVDNKYIPTLNVSNDFLRFLNERFNARYPSVISTQLEKYRKTDEFYVFAIDYLHCYDDLILQLDDAISDAVDDVKCSIGFRSCRDLLSVSGRTFFHCNDHAFDRISRYIQILTVNREERDEFLDIEQQLKTCDMLWNFPCMTAFRPWGHKKGTTPASEFEIPKMENGKLAFRAAQWTLNHQEADIGLPNMQFTLAAGKYGFKMNSLKIPTKLDDDSRS